jgi:DNA modification methylase
MQLLEGAALVQLEAVPPKSIQAVIIDPPYNIGIDYGDGCSDDRRPADAYREWTRRWIAAAARPLADDGAAWVIWRQWQRTRRMAGVL